MLHRVNSTTNLMSCFVRSLSMVALLACSISLLAQNPPDLQITAPANNTIVNPGQTLSIALTSPNNTAAKAGVLGETPIGATTMATSFPAQLSLAIPQEIRLGKYLLTATGITSGGQSISSGAVTIDVERSDMPTRLRADPKQILFDSPGETIPLAVMATFPDGSVFDAERSTNVTLASSNTGIVTIDQYAHVKALAQGSATITATYTLTDAQGTHSVSVSVPVTVPRPATTPSPTSLNFSPQAIGTTSPPQTLTITNATVADQILTIGPVTTLPDFATTRPQAQ